eukprot:Ihof_evm4s295 gene=Ihof_evmTU4s295
MTSNEFETHVNNMFSLGPVSPNEVQEALLRCQTGPSHWATLGYHMMQRSYETHTPLQAIHYDTYLRVLAKNDRPIGEAIDTLVAMKDHDITPTPTTYTTLVTMCMRADSTHWLPAILEAMTGAGVKGNPKVLSNLVMKGDHSLVETTCRTMMETGIKADWTAHTLLGSLLAHNHGLQGAIHALSVMRANHIAATTTVYNSLLKQLTNDREAVRVLVRLMYAGDPQSQPNTVTYILCIQSLIGCGQLMKAVSILDEMRRSEVPIGQSIYLMLIQ